MNTKKESCICLDFIVINNGRTNNSCAPTAKDQRLN